MRTPSKDPIRTRILHVRLLASELETVQNSAKAAGLRVSEYCRNRLLADSRPIKRQSQSRKHKKEDAFTIPALSAFSGRISESNQVYVPSELENEKETARATEKIDGEVARKHGHKRACDCIACERLRRLLRPANSSASANDRPEKHSKLANKRRN